MDVIELTKRLVAINSANPFTAVSSSAEPDSSVLGIGNEAELNEFLESSLKDLGFDVERQLVQAATTLELPSGRVTVPARWNVLAERRSGTKQSKRSILFFGHSDTVDVKEGWETDPFIATERTIDGKTRLYGLGASDMKSGLAAILAGCSAAEDRQIPIKIAFVCDEEFWSFGADVLVRSDFLDDVALAIAPEIGENRVGVGAQGIGVGRLGRTEYLFEILGHACHGADAFVDSDSVNAAHVAAQLGSHLVDYCTSVKRSFSQEGVSAINAAYLSLISGGKGILSVPDVATLVLDRVLLPGESPELELDQLIELVASLQQRELLDSRASVRVAQRSRPTPPCKPYFISKQTQAVQAISAVTKRIGRPTYHFIGRSVADENRVAERGIPTLIIGPEGEGCHTAREWVDVAGVRQLELLYRELCRAPEIKALLSSDKRDCDFV